MAERKPLRKIIDALASHYGRPAPPITDDPFELVLLENVAYLVSDERRDAAFKALRDRIGLRPIDILSTSHEQLLDVARLGGMHPERRVERLRQIAQIALTEFGGDLKTVTSGPIRAAKRALKKFWAIGDPGAEKILLFSRAHKFMALESNGLRVLSRLGFGEERKSYAASYRSAQEATEDQIKDDFVWLIEAYQLLRQHGQQVCKNSAPVCPSCPVRKWCRYYEERSLRKGRRSTEDDA